MEETTPFARPQGISWNGHVGVAQYGPGDAGMMVMFYYKAEHHAAKSAEAGRPVYEDKVFVKIQQPGERFNIVDRPVQDSDKMRWPQQWAAFQQRKEQHPEGTPVELLYPETTAVAAMMRAHGVSTIEQLTELSGPAIDSIGMGAQRYVNDAKKYIDRSNKGITAIQARRELEERDQKIRLLENQVQQLTTQINSIVENRQQTFSAEQVQTMVANMMGRPQHMPAKAFDPSVDMINANNKESRAPAPKKGVKRSRPKIGAE